MEVALPRQLGVELDPLVELGRDADHDARRVGLGEVREQRLGVVSGHRGQVADVDHPALGHHREGLRERDDPRAGGLALHDVVVEAARGGWHHGVAQRGDDALDEDGVLGVEHVDRIEAPGRDLCKQLIHGGKLPRGCDPNDPGS